MGGLAGSIVGGLFSLGGAMIQGNAAENAAETQANAAREAAEAQRKAIEEKAIPELKKAEQKAYTDLLSGYVQSQATSAPYNLAGLGALDMYLSSVGLAPPPGGSAAFSFSLQQALKSEGALTAHQKAMESATGSPGDLEKSYQALRKTITTDIDIWDDQYQYFQPGLQKAEELSGTAPGTWSENAWANNPSAATEVLDAAWAALDTPEKKTEYLKQTFEDIDAIPHTVGDGRGFFGHFGYAGSPAVRKFKEVVKPIVDSPPLGPPPDELTAEQKALLEQYRSGQLLTPTLPGDKRGLTAFLGSPEYQAVFGTSGAAIDPNATPQERFQKSPGYEFQLQEGVNAIQRASGPKGLMESGAILKEITNYGTGLANQDYTNYQNRLQNVFGRYQANLAGLTSLGAGFTAAQSAQDYAYGADVSQVGLGTATNIASLYGGLGKSNAEALMAAGNASASGQLASGAAWASGLSGFGSSLANAFQQQPMQSVASSWQNPLPAGQVAFGNSSILGAFAPSGFF